MRLLVGIAELGPGGAETMVEELTIDRLERGDAVAIASAGGFRADRLAARGARPITAPMRGRSPIDLVRSVRAVRREVQAHPPELVHVHNVKAATILRAAALPRHLPTLATLHGVPDEAYASAARVLRRCATRVVAVSADVAARIVDAGLPDERVTVIDNAVSAPQQHNRDSARDRLGLDAATPVALCVARLVDQKRHDRLVEAWRHVPTDAVLLLAGDGPNRAGIAAAIESAGLTDRVRLLGTRTDVDWLLAAADVCVLASDWEGLPISILEAMAAGVPVVAPAVGGLADTLGDAVDLVAPGSADDLGAGLALALTDGSRRDLMRGRARGLVQQRFGVERMRAAYEREYERLLD